MYQFKEMPKNIVIIDEKTDMPDDLMGSDTAAAPYERVPPPSDMLLQATELSCSKKPNILRGANRANVVQTTATGSKSMAGGGSVMTAAAPRIVTLSATPDGSQNQQSHPAMIPNATGPPR